MGRLRTEVLRSSPGLSQSPPRFLSAVTTGAGRPGTRLRVYPSRLRGSGAKHRLPPPAARARQLGWPPGARAPLTLGSRPARGQQQRGQQRQQRRARPAAARPVHSSSRGGGGSPAARRTSTGSPRAPGHLVPAAGARRSPGALAKLFVPLTCSLASARPPSDPGRAVPPQAAASPSFASAGRSVPGWPSCTSGRRGSPRWDSRRACPAPRAAVPGLPRWQLWRLLRSPRSLCGSTCHFPPTLQPRAQPRPIAGAGPGWRPSALCCRLSAAAPAPAPQKGVVAPAPPTHPPFPLPRSTPRTH